MNCIPDTAQCSYTYYHATEHFSEFVAFQPNSATLWPGAIVKGAENPAGAKAFVDGLLDGAGAQALLDVGFGPPPGT